jgi:tetratricopeptide (TPR) repeat protein
LEEAIAHFQTALKTNPNIGGARNNLGIARSQWEGILRALAQRRKLLRSRPADLALLNDTAWVLATNPNASIRNGAEAVELAQQAMKLAGGRESAVLDTLAAAYAETGQSSEAVQTAEQALARASSRNNPALAEALRARIKLYQAGSPYRDNPQPAASPAGQR